MIGNVPDFVCLMRTLLFFIRFLQIWYQDKREMCLFLLMYFDLHYIKQFFKYLNFCKWQGTFFDEFMLHIERYQLSKDWILSYGDAKSKYLKLWPQSKF